MPHRPSAPGITGAFVIVLLLVAAVAVVSWLRVQQLQQDIEVLTREYVQKVDRVHRMRSLVRERILRAALVVSTEDRSLQDEHLWEFRELAGRFVAAREDAEGFATDTDDQRRLEELRELTGVGAPLMSDLVDVALAGGRNDALAMLYGQAMPVQERVLEQMERVLEAFERDNAAAIEAMVRRHEQTQQVMLGAAGLAMLIIVGLGYRVRSRIRRAHGALKAELQERRRVEARLRETQGGLEVAVARRTAELEETTARLEEAQRIAGAGYWDWDIRAGRMNWSAHVFELFGLDPATARAGFDAYMHAVHPDDRTRVRRAINQALVDDASYRVDHRVVRPDGGVRHLRVEGEIGRDTDGRPARVLGMVRDITGDKASEERLWHLAHHDSLTGLPNRSLLHEHLHQALRRAPRLGSGVAVVVCDLDGFKPVNDRLGHAAGDVVLVAVARRLQECLRDSDVVARVGGDEFLLLLENIDGPEAVRRIGHKLLACFDEPIEINREPVRVGLSLGVALYPQDARGAERLIVQADRAMYAAKGGGGGGVVLSGELPRQDAPPAPDQR